MRRPTADQSLNRLPELHNPLLLPRARHDHLVLLELERASQLDLATRPRGSGERVALRERCEHGGLALGEKLLRGAVVVRGFAADVEQPQHTGEPWPLNHMSDEVSERLAV